MTFCIPITLSLFVLCLGGCQRRATLPDSADFSGRWQATLWTRDRKDTIHGTIVLAHDSIDAARCAQHTPKSVICASLAGGTHDLPVSRLVGHQLADTVLSMVDSANRAVFQVGGCCDIGELDATGPYHMDSISGQWSETRAGESNSRGGFLFVREKPQQ